MSETSSNLKLAILTCKLNLTHFKNISFHIFMATLSKTKKYSFQFQVGLTDIAEAHIISRNE
jgi:hypothetical protein